MKYMNYVLQIQRPRARPSPPRACTHAFARVPGTGPLCSGAAGGCGRVAPPAEARGALRGSRSPGVPKPAGLVPTTRLGVARRVRGGPGGLDLYGNF
jgi:hypothetical protein